MARGADMLALSMPKITSALYGHGFRQNGRCMVTQVGLERNKVMARYADAQVCFWNGKSKGSAHMILMARHYDLEFTDYKVLSHENTKSKAHFDYSAHENHALYPDAKAGKPRRCLYKLVADVMLRLPNCMGMFAL